ncbi:hypothetical protein [Roseovarius sp. M141]|uniref:hypothetical protein n=1 Tax=Roseovarius sp. M141 TaxID=2583806 RepID=UPI0020CBB190|nr:hypothetical protein [Roseovarius sp. M141]MCQ0090447.1 hypothetical protein [Roseovarius sp. M141]
MEITEVAAFKAKVAPKRKPSTNQGEMTAAAFARSAGIRGKGQFLALIEGGDTPAMLVLNPTTKRREWRMSRDDMSFCQIWCLRIFMRRLDLVLLAWCR